MAETHPILTYVGETKQTTFPLILVIGREANTDLKMENRDGACDFRLFPFASFWNNAYGLLAGSLGLKCKELKAICAENECSPIVFGNCLPIGIKGSVKNKWPVRRLVSEEAKREHVRAMFGLPLIKRVAIVIMSGVDDKVFDASREAVLSECHRGECHRGDRLAAEVPFFYGRNRPAIRHKLAEEDWAKIRGISQTFLAYCESRGNERPTRGLKRTATPLA
jgi:hypothetical protein